jgi:hypothetical protein
MPAPPGLHFHRYDAPGAREIRDTVALIHRDAYAQRIEPGDSFESHEAFMQRFDAYAAGGGFDLAVAYLDDQPAGQAWGWPLADGTRRWHGLAAEPEPGFTREDGTRSRSPT